MPVGTIRQCKACGSYTLQPACPKCGEATRDPTPPRYSPEDRWGHLRRRAKLEAEARAREGP
jgi:H/ACA ribonucleoprotein complex subunit 3